MPKEFWAEAVSCAVYMNNRSPTKKLMQMTPLEAWNGKKPNISHLRVFGSVGYVHFLDETRNKLDDKSEKLVFNEYAKNSKDYKFYNPLNGKIIISRNVDFDEDDFWEWNVKEDDNCNFLHLFDDFLAVDQSKEQVAAAGTPENPPHVVQTDQEKVSPESSCERPPHMRSLNEIYEVMEKIDNFTLFCLFADIEPMTSEEAIQDKRWRLAMNEEMKE